MQSQYFDSALSFQYCLLNEYVWVRGLVISNTADILWTKYSHLIRGPLWHQSVITVTGLPASVRMCACLHAAVTFACILMWVAYRAASESLDFADQWPSVDGWLSALQRPPNPSTLPTLSGSQERRSRTQISSPLPLALNSHNTLSSHNFASFSTHTHMHRHTLTHTPDKPMNSARGGVLDQRGTCFTSVWDRLTKTTETAKRKGEKRIWGKWEARRDKSWREWRQKRGRAENKRENKTPNFYWGGFGALPAEPSELCL